jgi:Protein of unknown function (DUF2786)
MIDVLSAELEAALVRELQERFDWENRARFASRLRRPMLVLSDAETRLGRWVSATRTLELSRVLVLNRPWLEVTSVLEHEMAHQFVDEVLDVQGETAHGETFRKVCAERGIDARAAGAPEPVSDEELHATDRIRKLLALAGSSNQHEAELAMRKAHELMLRHNIESTRVLAERGYEVRHLGDPTRRGTRVEGAIVGILIEYFFVKAIRVPVYLPHLGTRGLVHEIVGTPSNVEMATHVYAFLLATAERLWHANRDDARVRSGRDRLAYQSGVIGGFREKLMFERTGLERGQGLVWVGDGQLEGFYRKRHPWVTTRRSQVRFTGAHLAGREAGRTVVLHKPVSSGPTGTGRKLLRG